MGALGIRVEEPEQVEDAIRTAIAAERPVVIDCRIHRDDMVFPMAPAGKPIESALDQDDIDFE